MGYPRGMKWSDGYATDGVFHYFLCQKCKPRFYQRSKNRSDVMVARANHNALYHSVVGAAMQRVIGIANDDAGDPTVRNILDRFEDSLKVKERRGDLTAKTAEFYRGCLKNLRRHMPADETARRVGSATIAQYIERRKDDGTTRGAAIVKELDTFRTAAREADVAFAWSVPRARIKPRRRERRRITIAEILRWISAMDEPVQTFALTKLRSGVRLVEIAQTRIRDVDFTRKGWLIQLHVKHNGDIVPHWQSLDDDTLQRLQKIAANRPPSAYLFARSDGRPFTADYLRKPFARASVRIGVGKMNKRGEIDYDDPPLHRVGFLRHVAITMLCWRIGYDKAADYIGHRDITTTKKYDRPELFAELGLQRSEARAEAAKLLGATFVLPLPETTSDGMNAVH